MKSCASQWIAYLVNQANEMLIFYIELEVHVGLVLHCYKSMHDVPLAKATDTVVDELVMP